MLPLEEGGGGGVRVCARERRGEDMAWAVWLRCLAGECGMEGESGLEFIHIRFFVRVYI